MNYVPFEQFRKNIVKEIIEQRESSPLARLAELATNKDIRVVLLGEVEQPGNNFRKLVREFVEDIPPSSFQTLAVEWPVSWQERLDAYSKHGSLEGLQGFLKSKAPKFFFNNEPDENYFSILESARRKSWKLLAVDENTSASGFQNRDEHMAKGILKSLEREQSRTLFLGGAKHIYKRQKVGRFKTINETLINDTTTFSVLGTSNLDSIGPLPTDRFFVPVRGQCRIPSNSFI